MAIPADLRTMTDGPSPPVALVIALALAVGGLVVSTITGLVGTVGGALAGAGTNPDAAVPVLVGVVLVTSEAGFLLVGYAFRQTEDGGDLVIDWIARHGPSVRDAALIAVATAGLAAFNRLAFAVGSLFGVDPTTAVSAPEELTAAVLVFVIPAMLFAVGPAEEYLFRGVIQGYLRESFSARGAVGWSSVLFTLVHLPNLVATPESAVVSVPVWLVIGLVLGWLYERTGALLVPVAVHGLYNTIVIWLLFAEWGLL